MPVRECWYKASEAVRAVFPEEALEDLVRQTLNSAYGRNKDLSQTCLTRRYRMLLHGRVYVVSVSLTEEAGKDLCYVALWSEMEGRLEGAPPLPWPV